MIINIGPFPAGYYFTSPSGRPHRTVFHNDCEIRWFNNGGGACCFWQLEPLKDLTNEEKEKSECVGVS